MLSYTTYFGHFDLARLLLQRGMAAIYFVAFLTVCNQAKPLLGSRGLLPIPDFLGGTTFHEAPSLFHWRYSDRLPSKPPKLVLPSPSAGFSPLRCLFSHFLQVVCPFGLFAPQPVASIAAVLCITQQLWLIVSGGLTGLRWGDAALAGHYLSAPYEKQGR